MGAFTVYKVLLNASSHFILHQPSEGVCISMTFILHVRPRVMEAKLPEFLI